mmetsp:Transcript_21905/g.37261  ORF Transcript_21905/g.37261 Transcript_21905/m.37261 type:complete len:110 (-) Transcript_21905:690-1019(-)
MPIPAMARRIENWMTLVVSAEHNPVMALQTRPQSSILWRPTKSEAFPATKPPTSIPKKMAAVNSRVLQDAVSPCNICVSNVGSANTNDNDKISEASDELARPNERMMNQ